MASLPWGYIFVYKISMTGRAVTATVLLAVLLVACGRVPAGVSSSSGAGALNTAQLKFKVIDQVGRPFVCGPPVARAGDDESQAAAQFPAIKADTITYQAILAHSHPPGNESNPEYQLAVWRDWQALQALNLTGGPDSYQFALQTAQELIAGTVDSQGQIQISSRHPARKMCPICLSAATLIDTPTGPVRVVDLQPGSAVWTTSLNGDRIRGVISKVGSVAFPQGHDAIKLTLADGRTLVASAGHPLADGRTLADLRPGDALDGSTVVDTVTVHLDDGATYDVLPTGPTGDYWANGILVGSTLFEPKSRPDQRRLSGATRVNLEGGRCELAQLRLQGG